MPLLQRIGLRLAKPLFDAIKKEKDELKTELDQLKGEKQECDNQLEELRSQNENFESEIKTCKEEKVALQTQLSDKDSELEELNKQLTECNAKIESLTTSISSKDEDINELKKTNCSAEATKDDTERELFNKFKCKFSSIIIKGMTIDEALTIIYDKIESLKSAVANAESEKFFRRGSKTEDRSRGSCQTDRVL